MTKRKMKPVIAWAVVGKTGTVVAVYLSFTLANMIASPIDEVKVIKVKISEA